MMELRIYLKLYQQNNINIRIIGKTRQESENELIPALFLTIAQIGNFTYSQLLHDPDPEFLS